MTVSGTVSHSFSKVNGSTVTNIIIISCVLHVHASPEQGGLAQRSRSCSLQLKSASRKHLALRPQKPLRLIRDGEVGGQEFYI